MDEILGGDTSLQGGDVATRSIRDSEGSKHPRRRVWSGLPLARALLRWPVVMRKHVPWFGSAGEESMEEMQIFEIVKDQQPGRQS